jgi:hypothetical protein
MIVLSGLNQAALFEVVMAIVGVIKPLEIMTKASFSLLPPSPSAASRCRVIEGMRAGGLQPNPGKAKIVETRRTVIAGYHSAAEVLLQAGQADLAQKIWGFVEGMSPPRTTDELLVAAVARSSREPRTVAPREYSR